MDNLLQQLAQAGGQIGDLTNTQAPIFGPIRKFNQQVFGVPDYANPNLSPEQRQMALVMALGIQGGGKQDAARKFGLALRNAVPQWAEQSMLQRIPSKVPGFYQSPGNARILLSQKPPLNSQAPVGDVDFQSVLENARKLIRVKKGSK